MAQSEACRLLGCRGRAALDRQRSFFVLTSYPEVSRSRAGRVRSAPTQPGAADAGLSREVFPLLSNFLKAYLHEDYPDLHGSLRPAVAAFVADADPAERRQLARELESLTRRLSSRSPRALRRSVTGHLGSRWEPKSRKELVRNLGGLRTVA